MPIHYKTITLTIIFILTAACGSTEATATAVPPFTATAEISEPSKTPAPTKTPLPTTTPSALVSAVTFNTSDNIKLAGTLFGEGRTAVILAHQGTDGADQTTWHTFAALLAERGFTAFAFDFRGIGQSGGTEDRDKLDIDLAAALQFLRDQGHERIICVGASMGGTTCIRKAFDDEFAGLVTLSSAMITGWGTGIEVTEDELTQLTLPKIFITAEDDNYLVINHTIRMYEKSPEPKALYLLPGSEHGTDLFATDAGDELTTILLDFLEGVPDMPIASSSTSELEERVDDLMVTAVPQPTAAVPQPTAPPLPPTAESATGSLSFIDSGQQLGDANSWDVALGDLDGDGDLDAFVANSAQGEAQSAVWLNDGQGAFARSEQSLGYGQGVALGDLDGDDDLDAVVASWSKDEHSAIWLNDGSGIFTDSGQNPGVAFRPALGDLDGDGDLDIFMAQVEANTVWLNDGRAIFSDTGQRLGTAMTAVIALNDLDGDGDLDALAGGWEEAAKVWLNDGAGVFSEHGQTLSLATVHIHDLALGDVDGDGDLDAFTAVASGDPNQVWLNDGSGAFSDSGQQLHSALAHGVALGDLDGDGDLDALTAHGGGQGSSSGGKIWLNDGAGQFNESGVNLGDLYSVNAALGDLDGDGDLDVFIAHGETWQENGGELPNEVWLNETLSSAAHMSPETLPALNGRLSPQ